MALFCLLIWHWKDTNLEYFLPLYIHIWAPQLNFKSFKDIDHIICDHVHNNLIPNTSCYHTNHLVSNGDFLMMSGIYGCWSGTLQSMSLKPMVNSQPSSAWLALSISVGWSLFSLRHYFQDAFNQYGRVGKLYMPPPTTTSKLQLN